MLDFMVLAQQCAPTVAPQTMAAVVQVESSFNPYAIGVVGGRLQRQPKSQEAKPIPVVPSIAPGAARPQRVTAAGSGPVKVTAQGASDGPPADHAPVLLRRASEAPAQLKPVVTGASAAADLPVAKDDAKASQGEQPAQPARSAIVF